MKTTVIPAKIVSTLFALLLVCLAGCETAKDATLTGHMWEATGGNHREPATNTNLRLYHTIDQKDVLVRYNEGWESGGATKQRAFLLLANESKLENGKQPSFLSAHTTDKLQSTALEIIPATDTNAPKSEKLQAVVQSDGQHFALISNGNVLGYFCLPTYGKISTSGKIARALFLPATAFGDAGVYGGATAAYAGLALWKSMGESHTTIRP